MGTRQTFLICRVSNSRNSANFASLPCVNVQALGKLFLFAVCHGPGTRQTLTPLPCVTDQALGKASTFAVCHILRTRQTRPRMHGILASLPSFIAQTLGKEAILVPECTEFCHMYTLPNIFTLALGKLLLPCSAARKHTAWPPWPGKLPRPPLVLLPPSSLCEKELRKLVRYV